MLVKGPHVALIDKNSWNKIIFGNIAAGAVAAKG